MSESCFSQADTSKIKVRKDTVARIYDKTIISNEVMKVNDLKLKPFKPDPLKVLWMAAIIPGYGQILNQKYWKLPIVYGGFLGCAYAVSWNSATYQSYLTAYLDKTDNDPNTNSFLLLIPQGRTVSSYGGDAEFTSLLKTKLDVYHRYRDLSIIASIGFYALTIIDAFVDAQLFDFDISPDLSMHVQPTLLNNDFNVPNTLAMQCSINLK